MPGSISWDTLIVYVILQKYAWTPYKLNTCSEFVYDSYHGWKAVQFFILSVICITLLFLYFS